MIRWVIVIFVGLIIFPVLIPELRKLTWRMPGDLRFKLGGHLCCLPFGTTVLVSALVFLLAEIVAFD
jgi:Protein of unknown function (DUF2905)